MDHSRNRSYFSNNSKSGTPTKYDDDSIKYDMSFDDMRGGGDRKYI